MSAQASCQKFVIPMRARSFVLLLSASFRVNFVFDIVTEVDISLLAVVNCDLFVCCKTALGWSPLDKFGYVFALSLIASNWKIKVFEVVDVVV